MQHSGYALVRFFFLLTFAVAIPAIVSGGIAERAKFNPQLVATLIIVGFIYPFFEGIAWNGRFGVQAWLTHAFGGWVALPAVLLLGVWPRHGMCGALGGLAAGVFGLPALGGLGGGAFMSQRFGTPGGIAIALAGGAAVYGALKATVGLRLDREAEFDGADLSIHRISATPERD
jgi:ammonia channel protein AmtB